MLNAEKTHCPAGHEYDFVDANGRRRCRRCTDAAKVRHRQRQAEERPYATSQYVRVLEGATRASPPELVQLERDTCMTCDATRWLYCRAARVDVRVCGRCAQRLWSGI